MINLRPYQLDTVTQAYQRQRGVIRIGTGGGKSWVAASITHKLQVPTLILIHKRDIFWQLIDTFETGLGVSIGRIGDGVVDIQPVTVGMIQTISRLFDPKSKKDKEEWTDVDDPASVVQYVKSVRCVIVDEGHHVSQGQYETVLSHCDNSYYRFALSATPFRSDQADIVLEAYTAKKFVDISASFLITQGYLAAPTIYMCEFHHKRQPTDIKYPQLYKQEIVTNSSRNQYIVDLAKKALGNNKTVLIAVTHIEHGELLEALCKSIEKTSIFVQGETDSKSRQKVLADLNERKVKLVISTSVFGEGIDVPNLDVLINAKAAESAVDSLQLAGRALRITPQKTKATIIDILDVGCRYFEKHAKSRIETYQIEPLYKLHIVDSIDQVQFS